MSKEKVLLSVYTSKDLLDALDTVAEKNCRNRSSQAEFILRNDEEIKEILSSNK